MATPEIKRTLEINGYFHDSVELADVNTVNGQSVERRLTRERNDEYLTN
jgi:hypothetical protein